MKRALAKPVGRLIENVRAGARARANADRFSLWAEFVNQNEIRSVVEVGVWRGEFAEAILSRCPKIEHYYLIDPWAKLSDWNKPLNTPDLEDAYRETMERMAPFGDSVVVLRGRTREVAGQLPEIDFAYIDGDHTLRGITIDLLTLWPKIRSGGWVGGDDFSKTIWQHSSRYEPSLVFPYAVHFAEAMDAPITALPQSQFLIEKVQGFAFTDPEKDYPSTELKSHLGFGSGLLAKLR